MQAAPMSRTCALYSCASALVNTFLSSGLEYCSQSAMFGCFDGSMMRLGCCDVEGERKCDVLAVSKV